MTVRRRQCAGGILLGVLAFGILQGILLAALACVLMLLTQAARPHVAILGRIPGTQLYGDRARHPENELIPGVLVFRPEGPLLYVGAESVEEVMLAAIAAAPFGSIRDAVCDLSAAPNMDFAGAQMLRRLNDAFAARGTALRIVGAHGSVRDLLRRAGLLGVAGGIERGTSVESALAEIERERA